MRLSSAQAKVRRRLVGVVFLLVFALLVWLSVALYNKQFTPVAMVTLYTDSVGNEMHPGADVMVRGVQVGEVRSISADGTGARLELAIQPNMVAHLPANVTAMMVPTTLLVICPLMAVIAVCMFDANVVAFELQGMAAVVVVPLDRVKVPPLMLPVKVTVCTALLLDVPGVVVATLTVAAAPLLTVRLLASAVMVGRGPNA